MAQFWTKNSLSNQQSYSGYDNSSIVNDDNDHSYFAKVKRQIESFVSINKSISIEMINFMEQLDLSFQKYILPLLEQDLNQKVKYTRSVTDRLFEIEQAISVYILQEVERAKFKIASSQDDFEYLYIHSLTLFSNIVFAYEVFQSQPALLFNSQAKSFKYRLIAWMKIMQKRQHEVFVPLRDEEEQQNAHRNALTIYENIKTILDNAIKENRQLSKEIKALEKKSKEQENAGFFKRLFGAKQDYVAEIEQLSQKEAGIRRLTFIEIIKQAKKYPRNVIYLEYENVISITETHRHYAINVGKNDFTRLPILIQLPEEKEFFDINQTYNGLLASFATINQDWTIEHFEEHYKQG